MSSSSPIKVALLDDYVDIATPYFSHIPNIALTSYPDTILPRDSSSTSALIERLKPYTVILSMRERTPFPRSVLSALPNLKLLITTGPRNLAIDLVAASEHGIVVSGTSAGRNKSDHRPTNAAFPTDYTPPDPRFDATTQQMFALLLSLASRIPFDYARLSATGGHDGSGIDDKGGNKQRQPWQTKLGFSLSNKTLGLLGLGRLGSNAARTAILGFGMKVVAWSTNLTQEAADAAAERVGIPKGHLSSSSSQPSIVVMSSKEDLLRTADVVSLHYVLSPRSRGMLGASELALMKPSAVLVNTSRGPLVDEEALLDVLNKGKIRGAALDVFDTEPLPQDSAWRTTRWGEEGRSEVVFSPHMGYGVEEMLSVMYAEQADSLERYVRGEEVPDRLN